MKGEDSNAIRDADRDSLFVLPLSMIPLETPALKKARMIKNARLESVIELFGGKGTNFASGQIMVSNVSKEFEIRGAKDLVILNKLAELPSFDVFSLRVLLRKHDIPVNDHNDLALSSHKKQELAIYMKEFTRQLILKVYADDETIQDYKDVLALFRHPNVREARRKLKTIASRLEMRIENLPKFFEDYGDLFLSISYYKHCLNQITPAIIDFRKSVDDVCNSYQLRNNNYMTQTCKGTQFAVNHLFAVITGQFDKFDQTTKRLWDDISEEKFRKAESMIQGSYVDIARRLCGLTVKMDAWESKFPNHQVGGPMQRAEFIRSEINCGISSITSRPCPI